MNGNGTVVIHIMGHEHLVILKLFDSGDVRFHTTGRRFYREFHHLGPAVVRVLPDFRKYRISKLFADLQRGSEAEIRILRI